MLETVNITSIWNSWATELEEHLPQCTSIGTATGIGLYFDSNPMDYEPNVQHHLIGGVIERVVDLLHQNQSAFLTIELTEFLYFIDNCNRKTVDGIELSELSSQLESLVADQALRLVRNNQFDPYIGGFYQMYYFLVSEKRADIVKEGIYLLEQQSKYIDDRLAYFDSGFREEELCLSITHGLAFYLQYLCICFEKGLLSDIKLIEAYAHFLYNQCDEDSANTSFFPDYLNDTRNSRLCLCYGDAGILYSLWKAFRILGSKTKLAQVEMLMLKTTDRIEEESTGVVDSSLLYGSAGLYLFYHECYRKTGKQGLKNAAAYWKRIALDQVSASMNGLKYRDGQDSSKIHSFKFHEGLTGTLAVLGANNWKELQKLNYFFYLN